MINSPDGADSSLNKLLLLLLVVVLVVVAISPMAGLSMVWVEFNFVFLQDFIFNLMQGANFSLVNVVVPFKIARKMSPR